MPGIELPPLKRRIHAKLHTYGRSAKLGRNIYKLSRGLRLADILTARGWHVVKQTKHYLFAEAPTDSPPEDSLVIQIDVPTQEQVLDVAQRIHTASPDNPWVAAWGEWIAAYFPLRRASSAQEVDPFTGEHIGEPKPGGWIEPRFNVGEHGVFQATVDAVGGANRYSESVLLVTQRAPSPFDEHVSPSDEYLTGPSEFIEGRALEVELTRYERSAAARRACIKRWGTRCCVCGFDFFESYGELGADYIQVHHLVPLAEVSEEYEVDPIKDLRPVCPNCHAMIHRRDPPLTIDELRTCVDSARGC